MKIARRDIVGVSLMSMAVVALPQQSWGQEARVQDGPALQADDGFADIIVTARKVGEASQSLPITISAFNGQEIQNKVVLNVQDLQTVTPGLTVSNNPTGGVPIFAIRGTATELGIDGGVAIYLNDVPLMSTVGVMNAFYDISTVEVLKGPQGTQFGTNTTGGTLTVRTNTPTDRLEGYAKAGLGNYSRREVEGMVNIPVNDVLGFRVAGNYVRRDGYVKNLIAAGGAPEDFADENHYSLRGSMRLSSGPIESLLVLDYYNRDEAPSATVPTIFGPNAGLGINLAALGARTGTRKTIYVGADPSGVAKDLYGKADLFGLEHRVNIELSDNLSLRNVIGYRHDHTTTSEDTSGGSLALVNVLKDTMTSQWTDDLTLRFTGLGGRLRTSLGGFILVNDKTEGQNANVAQSVYLAFFNAPLVTIIHTFEKKRFTSKSVYFNADLDITDSLGISGGFRYNWDHVSSRVSLAQANAVLPDYGFNFLPDAGTPCSAGALLFYTDKDPAACIGRRSGSFRAPSWNFVVTNKFAPHILGYAKISHGYLAGGTNFTMREVPFFAPEKTTMIEAGIKADWTIGTRPVRTNMAIYRGRTTDKQVFVNANYDDGFAGYGVLNAAKQTVYGAEFDIRFSPVENLTLDASYNYIHSKFDRFVLPGLGGNADGLTGITLVPPTDLTGATPAQTPTHQANVAATYEWPVAPSTGKITSTISGYYTSKITQTNVFGTYNASFGKQYNELSGHVVANASIGWESILGSSFSAQFWIRNIFDKAYITSRNAQFQAWGYATATFGAPRTYGASATYRF